MSRLLSIRELETNMKFNHATFKVFDNEKKILEDVNNAKSLKDEMINSGLDAVVLNEKCDPIIIQLMDYQKYEYNKKKAEKMNLKKQKASIQKMKEVKFHLGIAANDMNYKKNHIKQFLKDNCKVKVEVFLRGREMDYQDSAKELLNNIITDFKEEYTVDQITCFKNSIFTYVSK